MGLSAPYVEKRFHTRSLLNKVLLCVHNRLTAGDAVLRSRGKTFLSLFEAIQSLDPSLAHAIRCLNLALCWKEDAGAR